MRQWTQPQPLDEYAGGGRGAAGDLGEAPAAGHGEARSNREAKKACRTRGQTELLRRNNHMRDHHFVLMKTGCIEKYLLAGAAPRQFHADWLAGDRAPVSGVGIVHHFANDFEARTGPDLGGVDRDVTIVMTEKNS